MRQKKNYTFSAILETVKRNRVTAAVFLPHHIIIELPRGRLRVTGIINGEPFSLSIQSRKDGTRFFTIGASLREAARLESGDQVRVSFRILGTKVVDLPDNFESVIAMESEKRLMKKSARRAKKDGLLSDYADAIRNLDSRVRKAFDIVQRSKSIPRAQQPNKKPRNK
jgi:hypothetical protein